MTARRMRIGELAAASGVTRDTLRYYERQGLLPRSGRTAGGFREYDGATIDRVRFVKQAQAHGLSLRDIRDLIGGRPHDHGVRCRHVRDVLARKLNELEIQRRELDALCRTLGEHLEMCNRAIEAQSPNPCPVVVNLARGGRS